MEDGYFHKSHPARVRGLKQQHWIAVLNNIQVAPRAGAWIETTRQLLNTQSLKVAPRAGAWIETSFYLY